MQIQPTIYWFQKVEAPSVFSHLINDPMLTAESDFIPFVTCFSCAGGHFTLRKESDYGVIKKVWAGAIYGIMRDNGTNVDLTFMA